MSGARTAAILSAILCIAACSGGDSGGAPPVGTGDSGGVPPVGTGDSGGVPPDGTSAPFAIESLPLDLAADVWQWPIVEGTWPAYRFPPVHIFGKEYQGKVEAALTFNMLKVGTTVLSPISGQVGEVREQADTCDFELFIGDESGAPPIALDHLVPTVQRGDVVTAGQPVGTVPKWQCKESYGGLELMMIEITGGQVLALCPANFFSTALMEAWKPALATVMNDWNTHAVGRGYVTYSSAEITNGICASPTTPG